MQYTKPTKQPNCFLMKNWTFSCRSHQTLEIKSVTVERKRFLINARVVRSHLGIKRDLFGAIFLSS